MYLKVLWWSRTWLRYQVRYPGIHEAIALGADARGLKIRTTLTVGWEYLGPDDKGRQYPQYARMLSPSFKIPARIPNLHGDFSHG